jgi:hypothetical protein
MQKALHPRQWVHLPRLRLSETIVNRELAQFCTFASQFSRRTQFASFLNPVGFSSWRALTWACADGACKASLQVVCAWRTQGIPSRVTLHSCARRREAESPFSLESMLHITFRISRGSQGAVRGRASRDQFMQKGIFWKAAFTNRRYSILVQFFILFTFQGISPSWQRKKPCLSQLRQQFWRSLISKRQKCRRMKVSLVDLRIVLTRLTQKQTSEQIMEFQSVHWQLPKLFWWTGPSKSWQTDHNLEQASCSDKRQLIWSIWPVVTLNAWLNAFSVRELSCAASMNFLEVICFSEICTFIMILQSPVPKLHCRYPVSWCSRFRVTLYMICMSGVSRFRRPSSWAPGKTATIETYGHPIWYWHSIKCIDD